MKFAASRQNNTYGSNSGYSRASDGLPAIRRMNFEVDKVLDARKCRSDTKWSADEDAEFICVLTSHRDLGLALFKERVAPV